MPSGAITAITTCSPLDMKAVRQTIAKALSLPSKCVLDADGEQDVSALKKFITVGRLTSTSLGSEYRFDGNAERETVSVSRLTIISVNAYGKNAYSALEKLVSALATSAVQSGFRRAGAAVLAYSPLRNLPAAIAGGFEQRAQVDISLTYLHRVAAQVNRAETVAITLQEEKMSLSINEVINAQVMPAARAAARRDLSRVSLFTPEIGQAFTDNTTRYITVASAQDVANLFGSQAAVTQAANMLFSVLPRPARAIIARWAREKQVIPAVAAAMNGAALSIGIDRFRRITDGALLLTLDGKPLPLLNMDFSHADGMSAVIDIIKAALPRDTGFTALWDETGRRIIFRAKKAGADGAPRFGMAQKSTTGTDLAPLLKLQAGQATRIEGQNATELAPESPADTLGTLENHYQNWYGVYFAAPLTDSELTNAHDWIVSAPSPKVMAFTALQDAQLAWDNANVLKILHDKNSGRLMVQYNKTGDDHAAALLGIALSTNWRALNSANTVKFKQQASVQSDDRITLNDAEKARRLGINFYTDYDGIPMLAEGTMLGGILLMKPWGWMRFSMPARSRRFPRYRAISAKSRKPTRGRRNSSGL